MGRPPKLTAEMTQAIVADIESGNYSETAAQAAGISPATFCNWMKWGAQEKEPYAAFFEAVACARARAEITLVRKVVEGEKGESRGAAFMLERTRPNKFAQRVHVKVQDELERMLDIAQGILSAADFSRLCEALASDGREEAAGADPGGEESRIH